MILRVSIVSVALLCLGGCGFTAPKRDPGFADVESLDWWEVNHTFSLSLGPTLLSLAANLVEDEPETRELLKNLEGVRVKIYEVEPGDAEAVAMDVNDMSQSLAAQDWEPVVLVKEEGESAHMLIKMEGEQIRGLTVITTDGEEAVFVNVMGNLEPELFNQALGALDVPTPQVEVAGR